MSEQGPVGAVEGAAPVERRPVTVLESHVLADCADPAACWWPPHRAGVIAADQSQSSAPRDGLAGSDEAVEDAVDAAARTMYDVESETLQPEDWQVAVATARAMVAAAVPFIAACVRAEAVADERQRLIELVGDMCTYRERDGRALAHPHPADHLGPCPYGQVVQRILAAGSVPAATAPAGAMHKPFTDDGVTYCGWDGHEGCGELWPCSRVRAQQTERAEVGAAAEPSVGTGTPAEEDDEAEDRIDEDEAADFADHEASVAARAMAPAEAVSGGSGHAERQDGAADLSSWTRTPHRLAVDAKGYVWRAYTETAGIRAAEDGVHERPYWSMAPVNPDNSPIPTPITYYVPEAEREEWVAAEDALQGRYADLTAKVARYRATIEAARTKTHSRRHEIDKGDDKSWWGAFNHGLDCALADLAAALGDDE